jgi:hypothetical protein
MARRFLTALSFPQRLQESTVSTTNSMPIRQRRKWTILACAAVLAFTAVAFATVGSSTFRSKTPQIQVVNNTEALAVVAQEVIDGRMRLHFKNISAKALNGFVLGLPKLRQIELGTLSEKTFNARVKFQAASLASRHHCSTASVILSK